MGEDPGYLTTEEVLDYLHINVRTIYRLIRAGRLPAYRVGRQWRFRRHDLEHWLQTQRRARQSNNSSERPRVLIVDDEGLVRDMFVKLVGAAHWDAVTASDGAEAIAVLQTQKIDLLVTDLKMPGMDGLSVIREARRKFSSLPIIIITGHSTEASAIEAINLGVTGYLLKPLRGQRFLSLAARCLGEPEPPTAADASPS